MTLATMAACQHELRWAWKMDPVAGGPVRRVWLCVCGQTLPASLTPNGQAIFDRDARTDALRANVVARAGRRLSEQGARSHAHIAPDDRAERAAEQPANQPPPTWGWPTWKWPKP